jgi:hypothetical protein
LKVVVKCVFCGVHVASMMIIAGDEVAIKEYICPGCLPRIALEYGDILQRELGPEGDRP